jgi:alginate O-acetyltransferase complex protein AlgI
MVFNSTQFGLFFLTLFPIYWAIGRWPRLQNILLLAAGYYFYASWNPKFLSLLILSTLMDYACGIWVDRVQDQTRRRAVVGLSMALNLGVLGYFKYFNFFAESLHVALERAGVSIPLHHLEVTLPIGISFYTFQSMSYVIDVYRREIPPTRNLIRFATFVSFFPHLVAGPIMRSTTLLPQISSPRRFNLSQLYAGTYLIAWGLVQKVVLADNLGLIVNDLFDRWQSIDGGLALLAIYAFAFQIYCDFAGYTDIARGVAKCLGFELPLNFNLPYFAKNPQEFWERWHISLSRWLRDYLYIPLGGSRHGTILTYRNLMLTMMLGGLWHGASWTFILWGVYHGFLLVAHRLTKPWLACIEPTYPILQACWSAIQIIATFHLVCLGWLLFRATSLEQVAAMVRSIIERPTLPAASTLAPVALLVIPLCIVQLFQYLSDDLEIVSRTPWYVRSAFYTAGFYALIVAGEFGGQQFIYFQF